MVRHFDHVTLVVRDLDEARRFFKLLDFREEISVVISGEKFAQYMGVAEIEADHVTLVLENASPRTEVQLLRYRNPEALPDPQVQNLLKLGLNHICFAVDDLEATLERMRASGFTTRNEVMEFHRRKLVFLRGPEGVTVELSQWL
jgi:catechol 2,3-dioxygenase-like lactoylglutathione lyase family enzyme